MGASKLTQELVERITGLDAAGATLREIAAATGVSTFSVRNALGRVAAGGQATADDSAGPVTGDGDVGQGGVRMLPDPVPRDGERALARWGCWARARSMSVSDPTHESVGRTGVLSAPSHRLTNETASSTGCLGCCGSRVYDDVTGDIRSGALAVDDRLPSELDMAGQYGVAGT